VTTVLLVDAAAEFRSALARALTAHGQYIVVGEASSPAEAIDLAGGLQPDIVIVDLDLPRLAGSDLIARLRGEVEGTHLVISSRLGGDAARSSPGSRRRRDEIELLVGLLDQLSSQGLPTVVIDLPNEAASVARARRFVESWCHAWAAISVIDAALLVVSELVTNAITHGGGIYELRLRLNPDALRIEVVDDGKGSPEIPIASDTDEGGRGLRIVTLTTRAWGVEDGDEGTKVIWAELELA
jgi:CheY-like chemotaxis protein/anti-sigma regulatory factor (Ser/Thr protein kinase)